MIVHSFLRIVVKTSHQIQALKIQKQPIGNKDLSYNYILNCICRGKGKPVTKKKGRVNEDDIQKVSNLPRENIQYIRKRKERRQRKRKLRRREGYLSLNIITRSRDSIIFLLFDGF